MGEEFSELRGVHEALLRGDAKQFAELFDPDGGYDHKTFKRQGGDPIYTSHVAAMYVADLTLVWLGDTADREMVSWRAVSNSTACGRIKGADSCVFVSWGYTAKRAGRRAMVERLVTSRVWLNAAGKVIWMETEQIV